MVTHPSTNGAQRRLTSLMEINALKTTPDHQPVVCIMCRLSEVHCTDPASWDCEHVKHWLRWAVNRFSLQYVDVDSCPLNGAQLMTLQYSDFVEHIPDDPDNVFWTHLELLRKYKFVGEQVQHLIIYLNKLIDSTLMQ